MEDEIREMLQSAAAGAPAFTGPQAGLLRRARVRRIANAGAAMAVTAAIVVVGIAGARIIGSTSEPPLLGRPPGIVSWINEPAAPASSPSATAADLPRACRADDLSLTRVEAGGAAGSVGGDLTFTTQERCNLDPARMTLDLLDEGGQSMKVVYSHTGLAGIVAETRRETLMFYVWQNWCGKAPSSMAVRLRFVDGGELQAPIRQLDPNGPPLTAPCNLPGEASTVNISSAGTNEATPEPALKGLTVEMDVPDQGASGTRVRYFVVLHNTTTRTIRLDPCPSYTESLGDEHGESVTHYRLNCAGAGGRIEPDERVTFEMFLNAPSPGLYVLSWRLDETAAGNKIPIRIS
jgi:hypothetical protein